MRSIRIIVGLGNPGEKYKNTRHNIGYTIAEKLVEKSNGKWHTGKGHFVYSKIKIAGTETIVICPTTYMNHSGIAVFDSLEIFNLTPAELLIVVDDFALPLGTLRIRASGSDGGHNGLASIIEHLGTQDFPRLRVGIGYLPKNTDPADFVLDEFGPQEKKLLPEIIHKSISAITVAIRQDLQKAMELYNRKQDL